MIMKSLNMALQGFWFFFNSWIPLFCITKCFIFIGAFYLFTRASLVAQTVKQETRVRFLGREEPLEKEMATHSSTLAWKIPWTEEPDRLQSMGSQRVGHDWAHSPHFIFSNHSYVAQPVCLPWLLHKVTVFLSACLFEAAEIQKLLEWWEAANTLRGWRMLFQK